MRANEVAALAARVTTDLSSRIAISEAMKNRIPPKNRSHFAISVGGSKNPAAKKIQPGGRLILPLYLKKTISEERRETRTCSGSS